MTRIPLRSTLFLVSKSATTNKTPCPSRAAFRSFATKPTEEDIEKFQAQKDQLKEELKEEAGFLTRSLYRTCLRSVRLIRSGNAKDEAEFKEREDKRREEELSFATNRDSEDVRLGMFSMMPPTDRDEELRSRAEYYHQYARENFAQEIDVMPLTQDSIGELAGQDVEKFLYLMKKGENDRQWLLEDMEFPDQYRESFPKERLKQFEEKAKDYILKNHMLRQQKHGGNMMYQQVVEDEEGDEDNDFWDDEVEDVPQWIRDKYPDMMHSPKHK